MGPLQGLRARNAALTGMQECITLSVDFKDQFFVSCHSQLDMAAPIGRTSCNWEGRSSQGPVIDGLKLHKYTGT